MGRKRKKNRRYHKTNPVIPPKNTELMVSENTEISTNDETGGTQNQPQPEQRREPINRSNHFKEWAGIFINFMLAIITYFLYRIAVDQTNVAKVSAEAALQSAKAADSSVVISKQNMRVSNRAYLFAEALKAKINQDLTVTIDYSIKNYGNSPARKTKVTIGCSVLKVFSDTLTYYASDTARISFPIPPDRTTTYTTIVASKISESNMRLYNMDSVHVYVHGVIQYLDIFDERHHSYFCGEIIKGQKNLVFCPGYNDMK